jgi:hypothetical protein
MLVDVWLFDPTDNGSRLIPRIVLPKRVMITETKLLSL